ncbi:hypothetical protein BDZ91DRAFT_661846, partial [Kalaharituber pfeilii]
MGSNLTEEQRERMTELIRKHENAFSMGDTLGKISGFTATIDTGTNRLPHRAVMRPLPPKKWKILDEQIHQLEAWDVIEPSTSETASPVALVHQNGKWRF